MLEVGYCYREKPDGMNPVPARKANSRLPVNGIYRKLYNPSAAARHLPLHRGGFPRKVFKSIPYSGPQGLSRPS